MHKRDFFAEHKLTPPKKESEIEDKFEHFKQELKEWAKIDLDSVMYHVS